MYKVCGVILVASSLMACNPTVRVEAPSEPIRIIADVTIKHEIKIKVEKDVEDVLSNSELF
ncbi:YnbE family lipoprotein [Aliikangiella sp. IMCC44359]|uniref:YnbE family lipoprotein n=1 Tax=Aliikangiella sp. IMCC44359 TaxID=3459125 RepID=UPI00403A80D3